MGLVVCHMGCIDFHLGHSTVCLAPSPAWADGNMAELVGQLGVEHIIKVKPTHVTDRQLQHHPVFIAQPSLACSLLLCTVIPAPFASVRPFRVEENAHERRRLRRPSSRHPFSKA